MIESYQGYQHKVKFACESMLAIRNRGHHDKSWEKAYNSAVEDFIRMLKSTGALKDYNLNKETVELFPQDHDGERVIRKLSS